MAKSLDPLSAAILDTIRGVLNQHDFVITRSNDASFPLYGEKLETLLRELARNTAQAVLCVQEEQIAEAMKPATYELVAWTETVKP